MLGVVIGGKGLAGATGCIKRKYACTHLLAQDNLAGSLQLCVRGDALGQRGRAGGNALEVAIAKRHPGGIM